MGIGVLAGLSAGLLGVGGGAVTVPLLLWAFAAQGFEGSVITHMALATSLGAMIITSISSAMAHAKKGAVLWSTFAQLAAGVVLGSLIGVAVAVRIPGTWLQLAFGLFLVYVALQMIVGFSATASRKLPGAPVVVGSGGVIGCVSMFFGIGGGSLTVPFLSYCGLAPARAVGTSAALGLPIALWGTVLYAVSGWHTPGLPEYSLGYIFGPAVLGIVLTSALFAKVGAAIAHRLTAQNLRRVFGIVLLLVAADLIFNSAG